MKKMMLTLMAFLTIAVNASAMSYEQAREEALFLTDKMAYELNLTDAQYEAAYEINLDYLMGVTSQYDVFGPYWERRNLDLSYILFSWQWDLYRAAHYFYRPLFWERGYWHFGIYARYPHRDYFYFGRPHFYATYRGGHSWRMNNNRSFYEGRRDFYRPGHITRDNHFGMRSGWDRGDYRSGGHPSSTHITGGNSGGFGNGNRGGGFDNSNRGGFGNGNRGGGFDNSNRGGGYDNSNRGGGFDNSNRGGGYDNSNRGGGYDNGNRGGVNTGGSFGGSRSTGSWRGGSTGGSTRSGGSFGGGSIGGTTRSSGSFGGGSVGGSRSGGSFGGGSTGGSRSGGSFGGGSAGGSRGGGSRGGFGGSRR